MLTFPTHLFNPARVALRPAGATISGGQSLLGEQDVIQTDGGGYWVLGLTGVELINDDMLRAWEVWVDHLANGTVKVLVPVTDPRRMPRTSAGGRLGSPSRLVSTSDDPYFPEAKAFATPFVIARIVAPAAARATTVTIQVDRGARLRGSEKFAIDHPRQGRRVYRVGRVLSRDNQKATVTIMRPLREAVTADTPCDFDWPSFVATLVPDADISADIEYGIHASVNISFREAF